MQCNAYPPKIDIWTDARYGAYRWYKIENLQTKRVEEGGKKPVKLKQCGWVALFFFCFLFRQIYETAHRYAMRNGVNLAKGNANRGWGIFLNMHYEWKNTNPAMCFMYIIELEDNGTHEAYK